jgi:hypothetical protein
MIETRWACLWGQIYVDHANWNVSPMPFPELLSVSSHVAFHAGALVRSSDSNAHYSCYLCPKSAFALPETNLRSRSVLAIVNPNNCEFLSCIYGHDIGISISERAEASRSDGPQQKHPIKCVLSNHFQGLSLKCGYTSSIDQPRGCQKQSLSTLKSVKMDREKPWKRNLCEILQLQLSIIPGQTVVCNFPIRTCICSLRPASYTEWYHSLANIVHAKLKEAKTGTTWHWQHWNTSSKKKTTRRSSLHSQDCQDW